MTHVTGAEATRKMQQLAVEGSRLRIPMLFGLDVIHGYAGSSRDVKRFAFTLR